jgi:hypothetical protein
VRVKSALLLVIVCLLSSEYLFAQEEEDVERDKTHYHYLGFQANVLLRQLVNLGGGNNTAFNSNPFLFNYSKINKRSGKGFNLGIGFDLANDASTDGVTNVESLNINFSGRLGVERKYYQDKKWVYGYAVHLQTIILNNKTETTVLGINPVSTTSSILRVLAGINFNGNLSYKLSDNVLLGTEANLNFLLGTNQARTSGTNFNMRTTNRVPFDFGFKVPAVVFLVVRI